MEAYGGSKEDAHALMRRMLPDAEIILVVPETCLWSGAAGMMKLLAEVGPGEIQKIKFSSKVAVEAEEFIVKELLKMELHKSPPESLMRLADKVRGRNVIVDLDVDYMDEFQNECYTRAPALAIEGERIMELGSMNRVLKLIRLTKPGLITLSEVKLGSIKRDNSSINRLLQMLGGLGYAVEYGDLLSSDEEAYGLIKAHEDFEKKRAMKINLKYLGRKDFFTKELIEEREEEIAKAMEEHFLTKSKEDMGEETEMITNLTEFIKFLERNADLDNLGVGVTTYGISWFEFHQKLDEGGREELMKIAEKYGLTEDDEFEIKDESMTFLMDTIVYPQKREDMKRLIQFLREIDDKFKVKALTTEITFGFSRR